MICHHFKCIFVHIPKTAGQSIEHVFLDLLDLKWETRAPLLLRYNDRPELGPPRLAHLKADEYVRYKYLTQEMFDDYFKFAFVRNPWSRLVSMYKYFGYNEKIDFNSFVQDAFKNRIFNKENWFVGPQSDFVYSRDGELLVDYLGRFEDLQDGFDLACERIGVPPTKLQHINKSQSSGRVHGIKEIRSFSQYQEYYDKESIDCVAHLYRKDIESFKYEFE